MNDQEDGNWAYHSNGMPSLLAVFYSVELEDVKRVVPYLRCVFECDTML